MDDPASAPVLSEPTALVAVGATHVEVRGADAARRRRMWIEVSVVGLIAVAPDLAAALMDYFGTIAPDEPSVPADMVYLLTRSAGVSAVVLYMVWRSGERREAFGLARPHVGVDILLALVLFALLHLGEQLFMSTIGWQLWEIDAASADGWAWSGPLDAAEWAVTAPALVANAFAEELVVWGFLFVRLRVLLRLPWVAVALCAGVFGSYHIYQGLYGAGGAVVHGLVHGAFFAVVPRLWPLVAAHAAWDIVAYASA